MRLPELTGRGRLRPTAALLWAIHGESTHLASRHISRQVRDMYIQPSPSDPFLGHRGEAATNGVDATKHTNCNTPKEERGSSIGLSSSSLVMSPMRPHRARGPILTVWHSVCVTVLAVITAMGHTEIACAQMGLSSQQAKAEYVNPSGLPPILRSQGRAIGSRLFIPGQERLVAIGAYTDNTGNHRAQLVTDLSGKMRLDLDGVKALGLDTTVWSASVGQASAASSVVESLTDDTAEGFLANVANGGALRLIGQRFQLGTSLGGGSLDIYEMAKPPAKGTLGGERVKQYCFDSTTHLLRRVRYRDATKGSLIETVFDGWHLSNGQAAPSSWTRLENGSTVFTLTATTTAFAATASDGYFQQP